MLTNGFYKHLAPLEPEHYLVAAQAALWKLWVLSAKGAKCNGLGYRPRWSPVKIPSAEGAK